MEDSSLNYIKYLNHLFSILPASRTQSHLEEIMQFTKNNKFLNKICEKHNSDRILWECSRLLSLEVCEKNSAIITFGEIGDRFYIILKGTVSVVVPTRSIKRSNSTKNEIIQGLRKMRTDSSEEFKLPPISEYEEKVSSYIRGIIRKPSQLDFDYLTNFGIVEECEEIRTLTAGDCFGELALLNNKPRTATIEAKTVVYLAVLSKKDFNKVLKSHATNALDERVSFLKSLPAFTSASKLSLQKLAYTFSEKTYKKDQVTYDCSDPAHILYFIKSGEFKISQTETVSTSKYQNNDVLVKLSQMRKFNKKINFREVIKGNNEIFGYEEVVEEKKIRDRKSVCVSQFGQVYEVKIEDVKRFPLFSDVLHFLMDKYESECLRVSMKGNPMAESPKTTYRKEDSTVSNILYSMRRKVESLKIVKYKYSALSSLPTRCEAVKPPELIESFFEKPKRKESNASMQFTTNLLSTQESQFSSGKHRKNTISMQLTDSTFSTQEPITPVTSRKSSYKSTPIQNSLTPASNLKCGYKSTIESSSSKRNLIKHVDVDSF